MPKGLLAGLVIVAILTIGWGVAWLAHRAVYGRRPLDGISLADRNRARAVVLVTLALWVASLAVMAR